MKSCSYSHNDHHYVLERSSDFEIQVLKNGKKAYTITKDWCTCTGHKYRHTCTHFKQASESGMIARLLVKPSKKVAGKEPASFIVTERNKSIVEYGKKNGWEEGMIQWAIERMSDYVKDKKGIEDMVQDYNTQKSRK